MLRKDDILLTQPALWSKAKIYGQSIKYNQLMTENLESSTTTVPITNVVGTYVQVLEPSLVGHKVYVKIDYDNEIRLGLCFFKAYQSSKGVPLGYNLVNGQALVEITAPTTETEGVYTITSDMVHSGTNYLQVYYFVYANCPIGQKRMAVQFIDLTALGLDTIVNSVADFHNTPLGKVMQNDYWFQKTSGEIISAESPLKFYKGNTLLRTYTPTANPIVLRSVEKNMQSLLGKQNVLTQVEGNLYNWLTFDKNGWRYYTVAQTPYNIELNSSHTYLVVFCLNRIDLISSTFGVSNGNTSNFSITSRHIVDKYAIAKMTNSSGGTLNCLRINNNGSLEGTIGKYVILIDLTELGLDNLTAQQFYNQYHNVFDELANGQSIPTLADTLQNANGKLNRVFAEVDLGTLNYTAYTGIGTDYTFYATIPTIKVGQNTIIKIANGIQVKENVWDKVYTDNVLRVEVHNSLTRVYFNTGNKYHSTTDFKTAMSGVKLIYELATPTTENVGTLMIPNDFEKIVADNGIELGFDK